MDVCTMLSNATLTYQAFTVFPPCKRIYIYTYIYIYMCVYFYRRSFIPALELMRVVFD